ncbi:MAG: hypothetical protein M1838_003497 [Thelocarpon superellum]|nr:MAG: hypothetical protein M1838_003497 [Thelocarpon superellum]
MPGRELWNSASTGPVPSAPFPKPRKGVSSRPRTQLSKPTASSPPNHTRAARSSNEGSSTPSRVNAHAHASTFTTTTLPQRPRPDLPPTPPHQTLDGDGRPDRDTAATSGVTILMEDASRLSTPLNPRSPPTPDVTPPRQQAKLSTLSVESAHAQGHPSPGTTASFKTAREFQASSEEELLLSRVFPDNSALRETWASITPRRRRSPVADPVTESHTRSRPHESLEDFVAFDGIWDRTHDAGFLHADREWKSNLTANAPHADAHHAPPPTQAPMPPHERLVNSEESRPRDISTEVSLRERIRQRQAETQRSSTSHFAEQMAWPTMLDNMLFELSPHHTELRRFSSTSGTSAVVEALVVDDTPPPKRRVLRHKGKTNTLRTQHLSALRSVSLPISIQQSPPRPLVHRTSHIPERRLSTPAREPEATRRSHESSRGTGHERISVVIPERRSSLRSSGRPTSGPRSQSLTMALPQAGSSAPFRGDYGYFDIPHIRKRTLSESASWGRAAERGRGLSHAPVIPPRSSSLSAPTTRDGSRATSLTSTSPPSRAGPRPADSALGLAPASASIVVPTPAAAAVPGGLPRDDGRPISRYLSPPFTPFSNPSDHGSSPEAPEVREATAVALFPHHNRSLLVVQQASRPVSREREQERGPGAVRPVPSTTAPVTPPMSAHALALADSPLKNPRAPPLPPVPPVIQLISPTPHPPTPSADGGRAREDRPASEQGPSGSRGPFALVKRALRPRRYSDTFAASLARWKGIDASTPSNVQRKESKLSPFWLPRGFWDDVDMDDLDVEDEFLERGRSDLLDAPRLGRRVSYPLAPPPDTERGSESSLSRSLSTASRKTRRISPLPGLSVQIEYVGLKEVSLRLREARAARVEKAREKERNKIKGRISPPRAIGASVG